MSSPFVLDGVASFVLSASSTQRNRPSRNKLLYRIFFTLFFLRGEERRGERYRSFWFIRLSPTPHTLSFFKKGGGELSPPIRNKSRRKTVTRTVFSAIATHFAFLVSPGIWIANWRCLRHSVRFREVSHRGDSVYP